MKNCALRKDTNRESSHLHDAGLVLSALAMTVAALWATYFRREYSVASAGAADIVSGNMAAEMCDLDEYEKKVGEAIDRSDKRALVGLEKELKKIIAGVSVATGVKASNLRSDLEKILEKIPFITNGSEEFKKNEINHLHNTLYRAHALLAKILAAKDDLSGSIAHFMMAKEYGELNQEEKLHLDEILQRNDERIQKNLIAYNENHPTT